MQPNGTAPRRPVGRPRLPRVDCVCLTCGTSFQTKRSDVARGGGRYCKPACYTASLVGPKVPLAERVWPKVNKNGPVPEHCPERGPCWEWTAGLMSRGYGTLRVGEDTRLAHRVVWELVVGPEDRDLLHHCDNRRCVHADRDPALSHLFPGTDADNQKDAAVKDRRAIKLTIADVREIRRRYAEGERVNEIARAFGIHHSTTSQILHGTRRQYV